MAGYILVGILAEHSPAEEGSHLAEEDSHLAEEDSHLAEEGSLVVGSLVGPSLKGSACSLAARGKLVVILFVLQIIIY